MPCCVFPDLDPGDGRVIIQLRIEYSAQHVSHDVGFVRIEDLLFLHFFFIDDVPGPVFHTGDEDRFHFVAAVGEHIVGVHHIDHPRSRCSEGG